MAFREPTPFELQKYKVDPLTEFSCFDSIQKSVEFKDEEVAIFCNRSISVKSQKKNPSVMKTVELHEKHKNDWANNSKTISRLVSDRA